ncbi:MAG: hypothetical protein ACK5MN_00685 [Lachnospiraceae bacterium]
MKIEVRYVSRSGNTEKVAKAIAAAAGTTARTIDEPVAPDTELLFLGGAVYAFGVDEGLTAYIAALPKSIQRVSVFSTAALVKSAYGQMKKLLAEQGLPVSEAEFHCRGAYKFMHKGRPNAEDLQQAELFTKKVIQDGL